MNFNISLFLDSLLLMLQGMLGIFAVTVVIILVMVLMNKITGSRRSDEGESAEK